MSPKLPIFIAFVRDPIEPHPNYFGDIAGENTAVKRLSSLFAALYFTSVLVHAALPELKPSRPVNELFAELWTLISPEEERADVALDALRVIYEWAVSNQAKFFQSNGGNLEPHSGWAGRWDQGGGVIMFVNHTLKKILGEAGFEVKSLINIWVERRWLETSSKGRKQKTTNISGKNVSCFHFREATFQNVLGLEPQEAKIKLISKL